MIAADTQKVRTGRLRLRAERLLKKTPRGASESAGPDVQKLSQELQVHQVELEMQNDELQRTRLDLENSRDRFADLYDFAPVGYVTLNKDGVVQEANLTAARLLGLDRRQLVSQKLTSFITLGSQDTFYLHRQLAITSGARQTFQLGMKQYDDLALFAEVEMVIDKSGHGRKPQWLIAFSDITQRKLAQERIEHLNLVQARSEQELADFFEQSPLGLLWVGPRGHILRVNAAQLEMLGCSKEEVLKQHICRYFSDRESCVELVRRLSKGKTARNHRMRLVQKDGGIRNVLLDANALREKNQVVHSRWFVRDVTRRMELEREILAVSEREQQRIGRDLHDDLCQQLAGIQFLADSLTKDIAGKPKTLTKPVTQIAQLARQAMNQTREMARGLSPVSLEPRGLMDALRELAARTRRVFQRDCHFHCAAPVLVPDHAVRIHLYRIAQEAVGNAVKHSKADRIDIGLSANGTTVVLGVSDNGIGIPDQPKKGKRMGLRIMQYRAGVISGSLVVQRKPNGGTEVVCTAKDGLLPSEEKPKDENHGTKSEREIAEADPHR